jgi:hypothetical protein
MLKFDCVGLPALVTVNEQPEDTHQSQSGSMMTRCCKHRKGAIVMLMRRGVVHRKIILLSLFLTFPSSDEH